MRWYQTIWGLILLVLMAILAVGVIIFSAITIKYWWQIKHGQGNTLFQSVYNGFDYDPTVQRNSSAAVDKDTLEKGDFPFLGNPNAPITVVLFGDFRCPNTKKAWPIIQRLMGQYAYKVKLIYRQFPEQSIHPGANELSQLGMCAYAQGQDKYWGVHNYLFTKQDELPTYLASADIAALAQETGLDMAKLNQCLSSSQALIKINRDYADGIRFGVGGTPTFFINGQKIEGVIPWEAWDAFIKQF